MTTKTLTDQEDLLRLLTKFGLQVEVFDNMNEIDIQVGSTDVEFHFDPDGKFDEIFISSYGGYE